ncbi:MAG: serine hydrolase [Mucilaginibacter sp.]|nr:serine hydrolase [Mucilaginibacter sp.]
MSIQRRDFLKNTAIGMAGLSLAPLFSESLFAAPAAYTFRKSTPEQQGISSSSILDFINKAEAGKLGLHSLMVIRNGSVVAEGWWDPYKPDLNHTLNSLSKSFTSTGIGFAVSEGLLSVEDKVTKFFPDDIPANPAPYLMDMQVKHLLTMTTGHEADTAGPMRKDKNVWAQTFLSTQVPHQPGTYFLYDTGATYMLSAIITKITGKTLFDYLTPRLFKPLDITGIDWEVSPQGINTGGFGLRVKTEDIAKLGMLYLQNGMWNGKQVLPDSWAKDATTYKVPNSPMKGQDTSTSDWQQGYCYQFWRCRHNFFRGDGAQGQYCLVSRDLNTVIAITSEIQDMQKTLNYVWDYLLPGIKPSALPADTANQSALKQKLATLTLLPAKTDFGQNMQAQVSGKTFTIKDNALAVNQASLTFNSDDCTFIIKGSQTEQKITCGLNKWVKSETPTVGVPNKNSTARKIAATGTWTTDKTFVITLQYYETPNSDLVICNFENNTISIKFLAGITANNGGTGDSRPVLEGTV